MWYVVETCRAQQDSDVVNLVLRNREVPFAVEGVLLYLHTNSYPVWSTWTPSSERSAIETSEQQSSSSNHTVPATKWQAHLGLFRLADQLGLEVLTQEAPSRLR